MKYIFVAGAPGSKWSSVSKNIYFSPSIDRSDYSDTRTYWHDAPGSLQLMHMGVYFDPGMEANLPVDFTTLSKEELETLFDSFFAGEGVRIIKSHIFSENIDFIKQTWPDCPIILVHRDDDACLGWWVKCGEFNITYPTYQDYYVNLKHMAKHIESQNAGILAAWEKYEGTEVRNNRSLATTLGIAQPPAEYSQEYTSSDIEVKVI